MKIFLFELVLNSHNIFVISFLAKNFHILETLGSAADQFFVMVQKSAQNIVKIVNFLLEHYKVIVIGFGRLALGG